MCVGLRVHPCSVLSVRVHTCTRVWEDGNCGHTFPAASPAIPKPQPLVPPTETIEDLVDLKCPPNLLGTILGLPGFSFVRVGTLFLQSATCDHFVRDFFTQRQGGAPPRVGAPVSPRKSHKPKLMRPWRLPRGQEDPTKAATSLDLMRAACRVSTAGTPPLSWVSLGP